MADPSPPSPNSAPLLRRSQLRRCTCKLDKQGRAYATGKRKCHRPRVGEARLSKIIVNDKEFAAYFARPVRTKMVLKQPIVATNRDGQFDIIATVTGGGLSGQAGAVQHGISKALTYYEPERCARCSRRAAS